MAKKTAKKTAKSAGKPATKSAKKQANKKAVKAAPKKPAAKATAPKRATAKPAKPTKTLKVTNASKASAPNVSATKAGKASAKKSGSAMPKLTVLKGGKFGGFFSPLDDRILVEKLGGSDRTPGGLYIPDMAQERPTKGKVLAVGRGHRDAKGRIRPLDVRVGDQVLFTQWSGTEIEFDGATFLIMRETDLLGVAAD